MVDSIYQSQFGRQFEKGQGLPDISTDLDSVRAFGFEARFFGVPGAVGVAKDFTLAAKQISQTGIMNEDIEVNRVNDKVYYPGKSTVDELVITFDNLLLKEVANNLWLWFTSTTYDPSTGELTKTSAPQGPNGGTFKANKLQTLMLDPGNNPHSAANYYGIYPKAFKYAEFNYSTNDFHTIEVTFRYDFLEHEQL